MIRFISLKRGCLKIRRFVSAFLVAFFAFCFSLGADAPIVKKITVLGNEKVSKEAIMQVISTKVGEPLSREKINRDIKSIFKMGYFRDVQVDVLDRKGGKEVVFIVVEKPTVGVVVFRGVRRVPISKLEEKIKTKEGEIFSQVKLKEDIDTLRKFYLSNGYYGTTVSAKVEDMPGNRVRVVFRIKEKRKLYVKKVRIVGNHALKTKFLKRYLNTKPRSIFSFFTGTGVLDEEAIRADVNNLKLVYLNHGFLDVKVRGPKITLTKDKKGLIVTYIIKEGPQYTCSYVGVEGDLIVPKWLIEKHLRQKEGEIFSAGKVRKDTEFITNLYADRGYAYVDVNPRVVPIRSERKVKIVYQIVKNNLVWIRRINISGNLKTRDRVIRREVGITEGGLYSATALEMAKRRLKNTGYFDQVEVKTKRVGENAMDVDIHVSEGRTGSIILGAGFSSAEHFIISGEIKETNLFGMGYSLYWSGDIGGVSQHYTLSFLNPHFHDGNKAVGFSLYNEIYEYDSFSSKERGFSLTLGERLSDISSLRGVYEFKSSKVYDVDESASSYVKESEGTYRTSTLTLSYTRDTRDYVREPRHGYLFSITSETPLPGGDTNYISFIISYSKYFPGPFRASRIAFKSRFGIIKGIFGDSVPIYERFYVGGSRTLRGFDYGEAGPLDENNDPVGGRYELINNLEMHFPLLKEVGIGGLLFVDFGRGSNSISKLFSDMRLTMGFGIKWVSPMGPITVTFGFNPFPRRDEKTLRTDFSFGGRY